MAFTDTGLLTGTQLLRFRGAKMSRLQSGLIAHYKCNENTASDNDDLVTNGDFAADTDWTKGTGWTIAAGVADSDGSQTTLSSLQQNVGIEIGKTYVVDYTITRAAGSFYVFAGGYDQGTTRNSSGTYRDFISVTHSSSNALLHFTGGADFVGTVDNVSCHIAAAEDSSGNDHDGLLAEDTDAAHVAGKINGAFDFDGTADFIEIADHADFSPGDGSTGTPFSISAWVYMHDATDFAIATKGVFATDQEWAFYVSGADKFFFYILDESAAQAYIGRDYTVALTSFQNQWIHLVGTYNGGILSSGFKLYLNGERIDDSDHEAGTFVAVENDLAHAVWIGRKAANYANGLIDNVMFFSIELTPDEVKRLYNNGYGSEILAEADAPRIPRRNSSPLGLRSKYEK